MELRELTTKGKRLNVIFTEVEVMEKIDRGYGFLVLKNI